MQTTLKGRTLTIVIDLDENPKPSESGKTKLAYSSHGPLATGIEYKGQPLKVALNVMIPNK